MIIRMCWVGVFAVAACVTAPKVPATATTDYLMVKEGRRAWAIHDQALVRTVERQLAVKGYNPGPIDGVVDAQSTGALIAFQQSRGLRANGVLDKQTVRALGMDWGRVKYEVVESRLET